MPRSSLALAEPPSALPSVAPPPAARTAWTVVVPFFNEAAFLPSTLASLADQDRPFRLVLVDNGSTDDSGAIAVATCRRLGLDHLLLSERRAGKVQALRTGLQAVDTPFVATCDADTWYPPQYLAQAESLLADRDCVVTGAFYVRAGASPVQVADAGRRMATRSALLPRQCHTGGAGQTFRTSALRAIGGFDPRRWNYVLEDHEIVHRAMRYGTMRYAPRLWCVPSPRKRDRASIRWTLAERLAYSLAAPARGDWFFYRFLAARLRSRGLTSERIRERDTAGEGTIGAATGSLC